MRNQFEKIAYKIIGAVDGVIDCIIWPVEQCAVWLQQRRLHRMHQLLIVPFVVVMLQMTASALSGSVIAVDGFFSVFLLMGSIYLVKQMYIFGISTPAAVINMTVSYLRRHPMYRCIMLFGFLSVAIRVATIFSTELPTSILVSGLTGAVSMLVYYSWIVTRQIDLPPRRKREPKRTAPLVPLPTT